MLVHAIEFTSLLLCAWLIVGMQAERLQANEARARVKTNLAPVTPRPDGTFAVEDRCRLVSDETVRLSCYEQQLVRLEYEIAKIKRESGLK